MPDSLALLIFVIFLALAFDFANGLNDAANAIATVISTRVLTPAVAIAMAAVLNVAGAFAGTGVAKTVGSGIVAPEAITQMTVVFALVSATAWVLLTSYFGLPISASHSLIASIVGAGVATAGVGALIASGFFKVLLALILSPILGFALGLVLMVFLYWLFQRSTPATVGGIFGKLQILSAAFMSFSHGSNDAQKTMGVITMALAIHYQWTDFHVPWWVILAAAAAMGLGTAIGGWRVIKTLGVRITKLQPVHGFAAETSAAAVITVASHLGVPVSTTHNIASAVMGVGATKRLSAVRWGVAGRIVFAWVVTLPLCTAVAWTLTRLYMFVA